MTRTIAIQNLLIHFSDSGDGLGVSIWQQGLVIISNSWFYYAALRVYSVLNADTEIPVIARNCFDKC